MGEAKIKARTQVAQAVDTTVVDTMVVDTDGGGHGWWAHAPCTPH